MKKLQSRLLFAGAIGTLLMLSTSAHAFKAMRIPNEIRALKSDAIIIGKVVSVSERKEEIMSVPWHDRKVKRGYRIAVIEVNLADGILRNNNDVLGTSKTKNQKSIKISVRYLDHGKFMIPYPKLKAGDNVGFMLQKVPGMKQLFMPGFQYFNTQKDPKKIRKELQKLADIQVFWSKPVNGLQLGYAINQDSIQASNLVNPKKPTAKIYFVLRNVSEKKIDFQKRTTFTLNLKMYQGKGAKALEVDPKKLTVHPFYYRGKRALNSGQYATLSKTGKIFHSIKIRFKPGLNSELGFDANLVISQEGTERFNLSAEGRLVILGKVK